jgi:hypothetical protein
MAKEQPAGLRRYFLKKAIAGFLATLLLFAYALTNLQASGSAILADFRAAKTASLLEAPATLDSALTRSLLFRSSLTDAYGIAQRELQAGEIRDFAVVADTSGHLHHLNLNLMPTSTSTFAQRLFDFREELASRQIPLTFVLTPDRFLPGTTVLPEGLPQPLDNQVADSLLAELAAYELKTLDLRALMEQSDLSANQLFYRTDEAWTNEAAFWAYTLLARDLASVMRVAPNASDTPAPLTQGASGVASPSANFAALVKAQATPSAFEWQRDEACFAGGFTQTVGQFYVPLDDYTWIYPSASTELSYTRTDGISEQRTSGSFTEILMPPGALDLPHGSILSPLDVGYLPGSEPVRYIVNDSLPLAPRVLVIGDERNEPIVAYLSTVCQLVMLVDPLSYQGDAVRIAEDLSFDQVYISLAPSSINEAHFPWFRHYREA